MNMNKTQILNISRMSSVFFLLSLILSQLFLAIMLKTLVYFDDNLHFSDQIANVCKSTYYINDIKYDQ